MAEWRVFDRATLTVQRHIVQFRRHRRRPLKIRCQSVRIISALTIQVVILPSSDFEAPKKNVVRIRAATDRAQGGSAPAFFTEESLQRLEDGLRAALPAQTPPIPAPQETLRQSPPPQRGDRLEDAALSEEAVLRRLEEGLRVQREQQEGRRLSKPESASPPPGSGRQDRPIVASQIEPISENAPLAPGDPALVSEEEARIQNEWLRRIGNPNWQDEFSDSADRPKIRTEESVPWPSRRRRKVGLLLCALFLVVSAAALGVLAKEWIVLSAITNTVKSSLPSLSSAPPNKQPVEAQGPTTPAASETPAPPNKQPVEAQGPAKPAISETPPNEQPVEAQGPAKPATSETPPNEQPVEAQGPTTPAASETPAPPNEQPIEAQGPAKPATSETPPNEQPIEAQGPAKPATSETPPNEQPVEAQGPAKSAVPVPARPAASETPAAPDKQPLEAKGPATPARSEIPASNPQCNIRLCKRLYRSFRASDCTFQPFRGPRRICDR